MKDWMMGKIEDNYLGKFSKTFFLVTKVQAQVKSRKGKTEFGLLAVTKIPCSSRTYEGLFKWVWVIMTGPGLENMVQIETQSTPECQVGVPSQGWQQREEHRVVHHVQNEFRACPRWLRVWSNLMPQTNDLWLVVYLSLPLLTVLTLDL